jgi:hypothetical protein
MSELPFTLLCRQARAGHRSHRVQGSWLSCWLQQWGAKGDRLLFLSRPVRQAISSVWYRRITTVEADVRDYDRVGHAAALSPRRGVPPRAVVASGVSRCVAPMK